MPETDIHGQAVTDLVHLLAELLENATTFSSPQTKVRVTATRLPDGRVMIEIHDKGIGLTAEDFADINHKLANPPTVDAAVSQRMGLFVVGRLADRHGIRVQLRPSGEQAGTTSLVMLPDAITHGGGGEQPAPDDFTVSQIIPEQQAATFEPESGALPTPMLTAAELGFDDSRYDEGAGAGAANPRSLDPVNRSLMRDERRAALGGGNGAAQALPGGEQPLYGDQVDGQYREETDGRYAPQEAGYDQNGYASHRKRRRRRTGLRGRGVRRVCHPGRLSDGRRGRLPDARRIPGAAGPAGRLLYGRGLRGSTAGRGGLRQPLRPPGRPGWLERPERLPGRLPAGPARRIGILRRRCGGHPGARRIRTSGALAEHQPHTDGGGTAAPWRHLGAREAAVVAAHRRGRRAVERSRRRSDRSLRRYLLLGRHTEEAGSDFSGSRPPGRARRDTADERDRRDVHTDSPAAAERTE